MAIILILLGALEWTETTFADFRDGRVDPMCYVSHRAQFESVEGCVEFYARWDADNNGFYDLFIAGRQSYGQKLFMGQDGGNYDLGNTITFLDCQPYSGDASGGIDMADLDLDGYAEAIHSGGWNSPASYLYWGTPTGPDPNNPTLLPMPSPPYCHETAFVYDIDKDGYLDITICGGSGNPSANYTRIFWGDPTYSYADYDELPSGIGCQHNLEMADLDHDGWVDMVIANYGTTNASLIHWADNRQYTIETLDLSLMEGTNHHGKTLADFNSDGWLDIVFTGYSNIDKALIYWGGESGYNPVNTTVLNSGTCYGGSSSMDIDYDTDLDIIFHRNGNSSTLPKLYLNIGEDPYFVESTHPDTVRDLGNIPVNGTGGFTADFDFDGDLDIFLNAHQSGNPFTSQSPILWGPDYTTATYLDHDGFDHHGVFREPGNVYDRTFTAWYFSSIFDCGSAYNSAKNGKLRYIGHEPTGSHISFSVRSGPTEEPGGSWTDWDPVTNGYCDPNALRWRYVQYRAEFHYQRPCWLPWLEWVNFKFYPIDFELELDPDSTKYVTAGNYIDYPLELFYLGDERDSFHIYLRPSHQEDWRIELWDTAYTDTIPWYFKLDAIQPQGDDTAFVARIYAPSDAVTGDSNVSILWTKTRRCSRDMDDSARIVTYVDESGLLEGRIDLFPALAVTSIGRQGLASYTVPRGDNGRLTVYDAAGRVVFDRRVDGKGNVTWSDASTPSGMYFVRLEHDNGSISRKVALIK